MTSKRTLLRTVPATLLMTTAMAWNLPASAQTSGMPTTRPPASSSTGQFGGGAVAPTTPAAGQASGGALPPGFTPAMPASGASAATGEARPGAPRTAPDVRGGTGSMPARKP